MIRRNALNRIGELGLTEGIPYWKSIGTRATTGQDKVL